MIGIYKITNKNNGKIYIGLSNNIERRKKEHFNNNIYNCSKIDKAIELEGKENFLFEILEECLEEELDSKERYWIKYYNSFENGYNQSRGGQGHYCGRPKLEIEDVKYIRTSYNNHIPWKEVYKLYKDKISVDGFKHIWQGNRWKYVMPEVFTQENKEYYKNLTLFKKGEQNLFSRLNDEEVIQIRKRYVNETAKQIWKDYKDLYTLDSFKQILQGIKYKHLPIYKKIQKKWINIGEYDEFN